MRRLCTLLLILGMATGGWAQRNYPFVVDDSARVVYILDEVIVQYPKPARNPHPVAEISSTRIEQQSANSMAEVVKYYPGLLVTTGRKNSSELRIRGSKKESVLYLLDGRPLNAGYYGSSDLSLLPVDQIEKIQVVKGPASVIFGANAMGGIVNIITKGGVGVPLTGSVKTLFGDMNHREISGSMGGSFGDYSGWLTIEESNRDAYRLSTDFEPTSIEDGGLRDNSDRQRLGAHVKLGRQWGQTGSITLMFSYIQAEKGLPSSTRDARYWRFADWLRTGGNISGLYDINTSLSIKGSVFANRYDDELVNYLDDTFSMDRIDYDSRMVNWTYGATAEGQWTGFDKHLLTLGFRGQEDRSKKRDIDKDEPWDRHSSRTGSLYLEDRWQVMPDLLLTGGIAIYGFHKVDASKSDATVCPMVSLTREWVSTITTHLGASRSISFPTLHNLYSRTSGNPDLDPEVTWKYELGIEQFVAFSEHRYLHPEAALFYNNITNQIDRSPWTGVFRNIQEINTWGIDASLGWGINRWLSGSIAFGWLEWSSENPIILETPHFKLSGRVSSYTPLHTWINLEASWFGKRKAEVMSNVYDNLPDYLVMHGNITQPVTPWLEIRCEARNVLDANYEEEYGYPGEGRTILSGVNVTFHKKGNE
jgi:outer membrane cobalamin receptor